MSVWLKYKIEGEGVKITNTLSNNYIYTVEYVATGKYSSYDSTHSKHIIFHGNYLASSAILPDPT